MIRAATLDQVRSSRVARQIDTFEGHITDFIATFEKRAPGPQAFLVEQNPNWVTPTHFHLEHQFQVIVGGSGSLGRTPAAPFAVHYAAPETGYGPITAGPQGIAYLTLRAEGDTGAWYLHKPGVREKMRPGLRREQQHGMPSDAVRTPSLLSLGTPVIEALITPRADGLGAWLMRLPPNQSARVEPNAPHGGRHYVVTAGVAHFHDLRLEALSVAFADPDESCEVAAGPSGADVLVLQFPLQARQQETHP